MAETETMSQGEQPTRDGTFPITVTAQMRHGLLHEAFRLAGGQVALAEQTGIGQNRLSAMLCFRWIPSRKWWTENALLLEAKLSQVLGRYVDYDSLFPAEIRTRGFRQLNKRQEFTHDVPLMQLSAMSARLALPATQEIEVARGELTDALQAALGTLPPREEKVLKLRFGLEGEEYTCEEVAQKLAVTRERIRQIEARALRRLRERERARPLKRALESAGVR